MLIQGPFPLSRIELTQLQGRPPLRYLQGKGSEEDRYQRSIRASYREGVGWIGPGAGGRCSASPRITESPRGSRSACAR